jgi:uncharacterized membrane protein
MMSSPEQPIPTRAAHPFDVGWRERLLVLGGVAFVLLCAFLIGRQVAPEKVVELIGVIPVAFVAVGKFIPLWGISGKSSMGPYELGVVIWALDTFTVLVFVYSFEAFYKLGPLRRSLDRMYANVTLIVRVYPIMKRASVLGVMLFVLFPVSGTGALAASLVGLLLGMHRFTLIAAVSAGGCVGGLFMAFLASNFASVLISMEAVQNNPSSKYWIFACMALLITLAIIALNRAFQRALAEGQNTTDTADIIG